MKKIYRGWKFLQSRTGLGYDPVTDQVICSDEAWQSFIKVNNECNHLRHEGLRNKDLYYNVFEKIMLPVPLRLGQLRWEVAVLHPPTLISLWTTPEHIRFSRRKSILSTVGCKAPQDDGPTRQEIVNHFRGQTQSGTNSDQSSGRKTSAFISDNNYLNMNDSGSASEHEEDNQVAENKQHNDARMLAMAVVICALKDEFIKPPDYSAVQHLILEYSEKYRPWFDIRYRSQLSILSIVDVNADDVFDYGIDGTSPSTGTQRHDSRRGAMNQLRDMMADDMWDRYQSYS
ncbi:hypothetical protein TIFTF001_022504 [Ficus carica]|uniref:Myb/SANT-like domain-containing protein n=1 Tax=Ficus carica TaxID=3494 RepID=A0AA88DEJ9_FICCA|nr:hypothetical protein TIFTF001_022504 [Ficus carica]